MTFQLLDQFKPSTLASLTLALQSVVDSIDDDPIEQLMMGKLVQSCLNAGINNCGETEFMEYLEKAL